MGIHYDKETVSQIRNTDMIEFFSMKKGLHFKKQGSDYRCIEHSSLVVKGDCRRWFWNSKSIGGAGVIDYLTKIEGMTFPEAMNAMLGGGSIFTSPMPTAVASQKMVVEEKKPFVLPERGRYPYTKVIDYLCNKRKIDSNIVIEMIRKNKIYEDQIGNVVFVGFDRHGVARYASLRGTGEVQFRMECSSSQKKYSFCMEGTDPSAVYVFESPIDAMSHATLERIRTGDREAFKKVTRLSLAGTASLALEEYLSRHSEVRKVVVCLDNDEAGARGCDIIRIKLLSSKIDIDIDIEIEKPMVDDFNQQLMDAVREERNEYRIQAYMR